MANPEAGEVAIHLAGREWTLRPTYAAIVEIENATGQSIMQLSRSLMAKEWSAQQLVAIVAAGLRAGGERGVRTEDVGEYVLREGFASPALLTAIALFLRNALTGGSSPRPGENQPTDQR